MVLESRQLIEKLKSKGIIFHLCSEEDAIHFLNEHNYYVKITAYKSNFSKHRGQYVGLDFMALRDLSIIDMYLKQWILSSGLSVEHALKVRLLRDIQERNLDDFKILSEYLVEFPKILDEIERRRKTPYVTKLLKKYDHPNYPVQVYFEVIPLGEFVNFYQYYCDHYGYDGFNKDLLYKVKNIRNAAAHNNCVIHDLMNRQGYYDANLVRLLSSFLPEMKPKTIQNRLKNHSVQDFASLLCAIHFVIQSDALKRNHWKSARVLFDGRMVKNKDLYKSSPALIQAYHFCKAIIDRFEEEHYNECTN